MNTGLWGRYSLTTSKDIKNLGGFEMNPEYIVKGKDCSICSLCAICFADGPIPDFEGFGVYGLFGLF